MELRDYLAAIRRYWLTWVGVTLLGVALGVTAFQLTPRTYEATARVFVSVSPAIPNSAQFVDQRVKSYPDIAESAAVLRPVIGQLGLDESLDELQARVSADVPVETSQVQVTVSGADPREAAQIANAVADQLTTVVEDLETPSSGNRPVTLTVSDPASAPREPVSPVALYDVGLGLAVGLFLGLALAVVRSRMDTTVRSEEDVRRAWGHEPGLEVLVPRRGRARRSALTGNPAAELARRLEFTAEERRVRIVLLSPSPAESSAPRALAEGVAAELRGRGVKATVSDVEGSTRLVADDGPGVLITVAEPLAPLSFWRSVAEHYDGVVLVAAAGRVDAAELHEMRVLLRATSVETLAVVVTPRRTRKVKAADEPVAATPRPGVPASTAAPLDGRPSRTEQGEPAGTGR
ncbi:YveK family protein [Blastococcus sp. SYSU D00669]